MPYSLDSIKVRIMEREHPDITCASWADIFRIQKGFEPNTEYIHIIRVTFKEGQQEPSVDFIDHCGNTEAAQQTLEDIKNQEGLMLVKFTEEGALIGVSQTY
ncbi:MAG: hypothetical protein R3B92_02285 [Patescibacteria group bacterium]